MMGEVAVRPYREADREAVRAIAFDAGYMGDPADAYWRDFSSFADIWTSYYICGGVDSYLGRTHSGACRDNLATAPPLAQRA